MRDRCKKVRVEWFALATVFAFSVSKGSCADDSWPGFGGPHGNFQVEAAVPVEGEVSTSIDWSFPLDVGDGAPIVADGRLYVTTAADSNDEHDAHRIVCLDLKTGQLLWEQTIPEISFGSQEISDRYPVRPMATTALADGKLVLIGFGGSVRCLDASDGTLLWSVDLVNQFEALPIQYGFAGSPVVVDDTVIVPCGGPQGLLIGLALASGQERWRCGNGPAAYTTPVRISVVGDEPELMHMIYAGGNELVGFDGRSGRVLWQFRYPSQGMTNAVTPLSIAPGQVVSAGQGLDGTVLFSIERDADTYRVERRWSSKNFKPFYCNWLIDNSRIVGFAGQTLMAVDCKSGKTVWQQRGWTDVNLTAVGRDIVAVRGDGTLVIGRITDTGFDVKGALQAVPERVWTPPTIVADRVLIRSRNRVVCTSLSRIPVTNTLPSGTELTAMDAMYGKRPAAIEELFTKVRTASASVTFADFQQTRQVTAQSFGEREYRELVKLLEAGDRSELALQILKDWTVLEPNSIVAFEVLAGLLRNQVEANVAEHLLKERMVTVEFVVRVPANTRSDSAVCVTGNALATGAWDGIGVTLVRDSDGVYRGRVEIPRGDLRFKITGGSWESVEVLADGRAISNRRMRIEGSAQITVEVVAWKGRVTTRGQE